MQSVAFAASGKRSAPFQSRFDNNRIENAHFFFLSLSLFLSVAASLFIRPTNFFISIFFLSAEWKWNILH